MSPVPAAASLMLVVILSWGGSENASKKKTIERADLELLSARQYCLLLLAAARTGHHYSVEARKSGLKRHYQETVLYFLNEGYEIREDNRPVGRTLPDRNDHAARVWRHRFIDCLRK